MSISIDSNWVVTFGLIIYENYFTNKTHLLNFFILFVLFFNLISVSKFVSKRVNIHLTSKKILTKEFLVKFDKIFDWGGS